MSYIQDNLMPNEKILFSARVHPAVYLPSIVSLLATIVFFIYSSNVAAQGVAAGSSPESNAGTAIMVFGISGFLLFYSIMLALKALLIKTTTEFAVSNRRVIAKTGFIRRHTLEMLLSKIESVAVNQNILGRLLNFGTVTVIGTGGTRESFRSIAEPIAVRKKINQIIEDYQQAYEQHQRQKALVPQAGD